MSLSKIVDVLREYRQLIVPIAVLSWTVGFLGYEWNHCNNIKKNLEPNAIYCGFQNNALTGSWRMSPVAKNVDLDNNGKYESILLYENGQGQKIYQQILKRYDGRLTLSKPELYKD